LTGNFNAIKSLKNSKAPGQDAIPAELLKVNPELASDVLQPLFIDIWEKEELPREWHGEHCPNTKKGNLADCNNWRGVTLLSIPSKVFCKVVMMRIRNKQGLDQGEEPLSTYLHFGIF